MTFELLSAAYSSTAPFASSSLKMPAGIDHVGSVRRWLLGSGKGDLESLTD